MIPFLARQQFAEALAEAADAQAAVSGVLSASEAAERIAAVEDSLFNPVRHAARQALSRRAQAAARRERAIAERRADERRQARAELSALQEQWAGRYGGRIAKRLADRRGGAAALYAVFRVEPSGKPNRVVVCADCDAEKMRARLAREGAVVQITSRGAEWPADAALAPDRIAARDLLRRTGRIDELV